jgi:hypothetical protein
VDDGAFALYERLGFRPRPTEMEKWAGRRLVNNAA